MHVVSIQDRSPHIGEGQPPILDRRPETAHCKIHTVQTARLEQPEWLVRQTDSQTRCLVTTTKPFATHHLTRLRMCRVVSSAKRASFGRRSSIWVRITHGLIVSWGCVNTNTYIHVCTNPASFSNETNLTLLMNFPADLSSPSDPSLRGSYAPKQDRYLLFRKYVV